ncbi:hypothetical protein MHU86_2786 [Fragilaria crotonensis]|nr:hypothetical protein MHU86_2786 [Fragilaria crotonensis]
MANCPDAFALTPALPREIWTTAILGHETLQAATEKLSIDYDCDSRTYSSSRSTLQLSGSLRLVGPASSQGRKRRDDQGLDRIRGELSYKDVKRHSDTLVNSETRSAQDSVMLYLCIMATTAEAGCGSGLPMWIQELQLLKSGPSSSLDKTMKDMDSDIEKFNDQYLTLATKLQSRGEATHDLLVNLFKGYKACNDNDNDDDDNDDGGDDNDGDGDDNGDNNCGVVSDDLFTTACLLADAQAKTQANTADARRLDFLSRKIRGLLAVLERRRRVAYTIDLSYNLGNLSHFGINNALQWYSCWTEEMLGWGENWYFIMPNVEGKQPDGTKFTGLAIKLGHFRLAGMAGL